MPMRSPSPPLTVHHPSAAGRDQAPNCTAHIVKYASSVRSCRAVITPPVDTWASVFGIRQHGRMQSRAGVRRRESTLDHRDRKRPPGPASASSAASTSPPRAQPAGRPAHWVRQLEPWRRPPTCPRNGLVAGGHHDRGISHLVPYAKVCVQGPGSNAKTKGPRLPHRPFPGFARDLETDSHAAAIDDGQATICFQGLITPQAAAVPDQPFPSRPRSLFLRIHLYQIPTDSARTPTRRACFRNPRRPPTPPPLVVEIVRTTGTGPPQSQLRAPVVDGHEPAMSAPVVALTGLRSATSSHRCGI